MLIKRLRNDTLGNVLVEATVMMTIIFVFVLGGIDFLFAYYQYNAAAKAVEIGARIAAVWDPVATGLNGLSSAVVSSSNPAGSAMPAFTATCNGATAACTCTGTCIGVSGYSAGAMKAIVLGRGNDGTNCNTGGTTIYTTGMCGIYSPITTANVIVTYTQSGLGYAGRPAVIGGPVPTVTVALTGVPFTFYFLGGLLGFANITMPPLTTSITGEYLSSAAAS